MSILVLVTWNLLVESGDLVYRKAKDRDLVIGEDVVFRDKSFIETLDLTLEMNVGSKGESLICRFKCSGLVLRPSQSGSKRKHLMAFGLDLHPKNKGL